MRAVALWFLMAAPALADCQSELSLFRGALAAREFAISSPGALSEAEGACTLRGLELRQRNSIVLEVAQVIWTAEGFETLLIGAPDGLALDLLVVDLRIVPQVPDPWMAYYLDLQNRRNFIDGRVRASWDPVAGILALDELSVDLPGKNGFAVSSRVSGATMDNLPGRLGEFGALSLEALEISVENSGYADGLALGLMLDRLAVLQGDPKSVVAGAKADLKTVVAGWPDAVFPAASREALARLIDAGPLPWGRLDVALARGTVPLDRLVQLSMSRDPLATDTLAEAFEGAEFRIGFAPAVAE